jgi:EAL domain-containing protein (putative c-di-GMP-specific phosphodiesterase class I)
VDDVAAALERAGVQAERLVLEMTETELIQGCRATLSVVQKDVQRSPQDDGVR